MSTDSDLTHEKKQMRADAKTRRARAFSQHGAAANMSLAETGLSFLRRTPPAVVSGFMPIGDEIDVTALMEQLAGQGFELCLPVIVKKAAPLEFRKWQPGTALEEKAWGIREPGAMSEVRVPDIVLVPLLAFDAEGYRLGYGGGFYDRSLAEIGAQKPVTAIGVAFAEQEVPSVPRDRFDQRLDWILTPDGPRKFD